MRRSSSSPSSMQIRLLFIFVIFFIVNVFFLNIALEQQQSGQSFSAQQSAASSSITNRNILLGQQEPVFGKEESRRDPDGIFNGYPVYYYDGETAEKVGGKKKYFFSSSHCIGENYQADTSWIYRSCHYTFFCFDLKQHDFVVFQPPDHNNLNSSEILQQRPYMDTSQSWLRPPLQNNHVALGGGKKFTPRIVTSGNYPKSIFALDENVIMIPFVDSSMFDSNSNSNSTSPWLLIWDDFLPIYTLMTIFELQDKAALLLHTTSRHDGGDEIGCDSYVGKSRDDKDNNCETFFSAFWPLMRSPKYNKSVLTTTRHVEWNVNVSQSSSNNNNTLSQYVCSRHGLAGIGDETDHGLRKVKSHGWEKRKYSEITINHGRRAPILWSFRQFVMKNVGIQDVPLKLPYRIVISSTGHFPSTSVVLDTLKRNLDPNFAVVTVNDFTSSQSSALEEQLRIASEAAVFIIGCCSDGNDDGAAVVAPFVQKGSSIVIYYPRLMGGIIQQGNNKAVKRDEEHPTLGLLDWDILNNLGYSNVHWLPREGIAENQETLVTLVKAELSRIHEYLG